MPNIININNIAELKKELQNICVEVLKDDVTRSLKTNMRRIIKKNVYGVYSPVKYIRRGDDGGLYSGDSMVSTDKSTAQIARVFFTTRAVGNPNHFREKQGFLKRIEYGDGRYLKSKSTIKPYQQKRPFMSTLKNSNIKSVVTNPAKKGFEKRGFTISNS